MKKLRLFYELDGRETYEDFEPVYYRYGDNYYVDYSCMNRRALFYGETALPAVGARKIRLIWDGQ